MSSKVIMFTAPWCGVCPGQKVLLGDLVTVVDCTEDPDLANRHHVTSLPTFVAVDDEGNETARHAGAATRAIITRMT